METITLTSSDANGIKRFYHKGYKATKPCECGGTLEGYGEMEEYPEDSGMHIYLQCESCEEEESYKFPCISAKTICEFDISSKPDDLIIELS